MTELNKRGDDADRLKSEIVDSWRNRYAELHRKRWGLELPAANARRFLIAHDQTWADSSLDRLRRLFGGSGALIDCHLLDDSDGILPPANDYDCLVIASMELPPEKIRLPLRNFMRELLEWSGFLSGIDGGAEFLAGEGLAPALEEDSREVLEQGGRCFVCSHRDQSEKLAETVLKHLADARSLSEGQELANTLTNRERTSHETK